METAEEAIGEYGGVTDDQRFRPIGIDHGAELLRRHDLRGAVTGDATGDRLKRGGCDLAPAHVDDRPDTSMTGRGTHRQEGEGTDGHHGQPDGSRDRLRRGDPGAKAGEGPRTDVHRDEVEVRRRPADRSEVEVDRRDDELDVTAGVDAHRHRLERGIFAERDRGRGSCRFDGQNLHRVSSSRDRLRHDPTGRSFNVRLVSPVMANSTRR